MSKRTQHVWHTYSNCIRNTSTELRTHVVSQVNKIPRMKRRRREILCDRQMDLSLPVNQISMRTRRTRRRRECSSGSSGLLSLRSPVSSSSWEHWRYTVYGQSSAIRLAGHRETAKEWLHLHLLYIEREQGQNGPVIPGFHLYTLHLLSLCSFGASLRVFSLLG